MVFGGLLWELFMRRLTTRRTPQQKLDRIKKVIERGFHARDERCRRTSSEVQPMRNRTKHN